MRSLFSFFTLLTLTGACPRAEASNASETGPSPAIVTFGPATASVVETEGSFQLYVRLGTAPVDQSLSVPLVVAPSSTAENGVDFQLSTSSVVFQPGETTKMLTVTLMDDADLEGPESLKLIVDPFSQSIFQMQPTGGFELQLLDNESLPQIRFSESNLQVPERAGQVSLVAELSWPAAAPVTASLLTTGSSAGAGDLTGPSEVSFSVGQRHQVVHFQIVDDALEEDLETLKLAFGAVTGATVAESALCEIHIEDDDSPTSLGKRWELLQPSFSPEKWNGISSHAEGFLAFGTGGVLLRSDRFASQWRPLFTGLPSEVTLHDVTPMSGQLVAVGSQCTLLTSTSLSTWSATKLNHPDLASDATLIGCASNAERLIVLARPSAGAESAPMAFERGTNQSTWRSLPMLSLGRDSTFHIHHGLSTFMIAESSPVVTYHPPPREREVLKIQYRYLLHTSADGLLWRTQADAFPALQNQPISDLTVANNKWLICQGTKILFESADAEIWTAKSLPTQRAVYAVSSSEETSQTVAVGTGVFSTYDGISWSPSASPTSSGLRRVVSDHGLYLALSEEGGLYSSGNASQWTQQSAGISLPTALHSAVWTGTQFIAVGGGEEKGALILTSPNGVTWTRRTLPTTTPPLRSVAWSGGLAVAVGRRGAIVTSYDGETWLPRISPTQLDLNEVVWARDRFVLVGGHRTGEKGTLGVGGAIVLTSPTGLQWTRRTIPTSKPLRAVHFIADHWLAVGDAYEDGEESASFAAILTSSNSSTWSKPLDTLPEAYRTVGLRAIASDGARLIAVGDSAHVRMSDDFGQTWQLPASAPPSNLPSHTTLHAVQHLDGRFIAVGDFGHALLSSDGDSWQTSQTQLRSGRLHGLCSDGTALYALGDQASIQKTQSALEPGTPEVQFIQETTFAVESQGWVHVTLRLSHMATSNVQVAYSLTASSGLTLGQAPADISPAPNPLIIRPGEIEKNLSFRIYQDAEDEPIERLQITLANVIGGARLAPTGLEHEITLQSDDTVPQVSVAGVPNVLQKVGQPLHLKVAASAGTPPFRYQWFKNGLPLPKTVPSSRSAEFYLPKTTLADAGDYTCALTNASGRGLSPAMKVGLYMADTEPQRIYVGPTDKPRLTQVISRNCRVDWIKNHTLLGSTLPTGLSLNTLRTILTVQQPFAQSGSFETRIRLPGTVLEQAGQGFTVGVVAAPPTLPAEITLPTASAGVLYQYSLTLADGSPQLSSWEVTGLPPGLRVNPKLGVLSGIPQTSRALPYPLVIIAKNGKGSTRRMANLTVNPLPSAHVGTYIGRVERHPGNVMKGGWVSLEVNAKGTFSAQVTLGHLRHSLFGALQQVTDTEFRLANAETGLSLPQKWLGKQWIHLSFHQDSARVDGPTGQGTLTLVLPDGQSSSFTFVARRTLPASEATPYAGRYSYALRLADAQDVGDLDLPQGHGFGRASVKTSGIVNWAGRSADGRSFLHSSLLLQGVQTSFYSSLGSTHSSLAAEARFQLGPEGRESEDARLEDLSEASWAKRPDPSANGARLYPSGWDPIPLHIQGSKLPVWAPSEPPLPVIAYVVGATNATLQMSFAELPSQPSTDAPFGLKKDGTTVFSSSDLQKYPRTIQISKLDGSLSGEINLSATLPNGITRISRPKIQLRGQVVRIFGETTEHGVFGHFLLPQLPDATISPLPSASSTRILSGALEIQPSDG